MKKYNIGISILLIAVSVWMIMTSGSYNNTVSGTAMGAGEWPVILSIAMIILCAVLLVQTVLEKKDQGEEPFDFKSEGMKRLYVLLGLLVVFAVLLKTLGFYVSVAFLVPAVMWLLDERRVKVMVALTAGILLFVFVVFGVLLGIKLTMGMLG